MRWTCCGLAVALVLVLGAVGYKILLKGETRPAMDGRTTILLSPAERDLVLAEMRAFLKAVQTISLAVSNDDSPAAAAAARAVGAVAADEVPLSLMAKLPIGFKQLGLATHRAFDQLALDAEDLGDAEHTQAQLAQLLGNCVGCHAAFRFDLEP